MDFGKLPWVKVILFVLLTVGIAGGFATSAYLGVQHSQRQVDALRAQQSEILSQVSSLSTSVAIVNTRIAGTPGNTWEAQRNSTSTTRTPDQTTPEGTGDVCPRSVSGIIRSHGKEVYLFQLPSLMSKHRAIAEHTKVAVCCMTNTAEWAKVRSQIGEGWVQIDYIDLEMGLSWTDVPVCHQ